jgi:transcriptional regulator with XRE-family HTH domain
MEEKLTVRLRSWAEKKGIRPSDFARVTGYSYQHAYQLLRGSAEAMDETLGRVARCYGAEAVAEIVGPQEQSSTGTAV